jgi:SOS-response transcriptional repressor LexA
MDQGWKRQLKAMVGGDGQPTMKALSVAAGLGDTYVRDVLERGRVPTVDKFIKLAEALNRSPAALLDDEPDATVPQRAIPVISWVSAGKLSEVVPTPASDRVVYVTDLRPGDYFALEVKGTSMDRLSPDGSVIIVNRRETALQRGKPYVFAIRGEATYKLWEPDPPRLEPSSTDVSNKPIFVNKKIKPFVVGRVRRTILDL